MADIGEVVFIFDGKNISLDYDVIQDDSSVSKWHSTASAKDIREKTIKIKSLRKVKNGDVIR